MGNVVVTGAGYLGAGMRFSSVLHRKHHLNEENTVFPSTYSSVTYNSLVLI